MFHNLDQLRLQLERENLYEVNAKTCLEVLRTQFKEFFASKGVNSSDHLNQGWQQDFEEYTLCKPDTYRSDLLRNLDILETAIRRAVITYGSGIKSINNSSENALSKSVNETQMQMQEEKVDMGKVLDARLVVMEINGTKSDKQDTSSRSGNYTTHVVDAYIRPVNDQDPFAETTLQASFLKKKKDVCFSALYLQKKRNLLVFDHSHQQVSYFPMLVQSLSGSTSTWSLNMYEMVKLTPGYISSGLENSVSPTPYVPPSKKDYEILFQPLFDEYFNPPPHAVSSDPVAITAP
ncbi:hypothetical protein Tco_0218866 [Tanacetum coccineum]